MGLEKGHGVLADDVKLALRGRMRDGYEVQLLQTAGVLVHSKFFHSDIHLHLFSSSILFLSCQRIISSTMKLRLTTTKSRFWLVSFLPTQWAACLMKFCRRFETSGRKPAAWVSHFSWITFLMWYLQQICEDQTGSQSSHQRNSSFGVLSRQGFLKWSFSPTLMRPVLKWAAIWRMSTRTRTWRKR